jgi:hypothetical protein
VRCGNVVAGGGDDPVTGGRPPAPHGKQPERQGNRPFRAESLPRPGEVELLRGKRGPAEPASPALAPQSGVDRAIALPALVAILPREATRDISPALFDFAPNRRLSAHTRRDLL